MPLRVAEPSSQVVAAWRPPTWQRVLFTAIGIGMFAGGLWPYPGEPYEPIWIAVVVGTALATLALRPKLTLHEDALHIRGFIFSQVVPIEEVSAVNSGYGGLDVSWGDGHTSGASAIGEQANLPGMPGSDGRRHAMKSTILLTRDEYLKAHGLLPLPDPQAEQDRQRREFRERGWTEDSPSSRQEPRKYRDVT